jgi:hypothetical protein
MAGNHPPLRPETDCQWVAFRGMGIVYQDPVVPFAVAT